MINENKNKVDVFKITVLTINYNVASHVNKLVNSLSIIDNNVSEIIIIDNNSTDSKQIKQTIKTKLIYNKKNFGFSKAVNQGIIKAKEKFILLINPDCYLENSSIRHSLKLIINDNTIGAIGGKIKKSTSNNYQFTANNKANFFTGLFEFTNLKKIFPNNVFSNRFWVETSTINKPMQVESLCGAYMIIRKKINNRLNLFDERFFLYLEDIDFGNKINLLGHKVIFDPKSEITHVGGKSSNSKYNIVLPKWYISRKKYFKKHLNIIQSTILNTIFNIEEKFLKTINKI